VKGVYRQRSRWGARFYRNGKTIRIGTFDTVEEAFIAWYLTKKAMQRECRF
jgi:hypothetical protein